jgi:hypothetical protein
MSFIYDELFKIATVGLPQSEETSEEKEIKPTEGD